MAKKPHYIPPPGGTTTGAMFSRQRIDLTGRTWDHCVFDECTLVIYNDAGCKTVVTNVVFTSSTFVGDVGCIREMYEAAGLDPDFED